MTQANFVALWQGDLNTRGLVDDDYLHYFWPQCPELTDIKGQFDLVYQDIYHLVSKQAVAKKTKQASVQAGNKTVHPPVKSSANKASTYPSNNSAKVNE
jgi:exodeoxyribonuclease V gamma subunit